MLAGFFGVVSGVHQMAMSYVGMMASLVMVAGFMMLGGASMMGGGVLMVFSGFAMMLCGFLRHRR